MNYIPHGLVAGTLGALFAFLCAVFAQKGYTLLHWVSRGMAWVFLNLWWDPIWDPGWPTYTQSRILEDAVNT